MKTDDFDENDDDVSDDNDSSYSPGKAFSMIGRRSKKRKISMDLASKKGKHKCPICGMMLAEPSALNTHLKYTHGEFAYMCPCQRAFSRPSNLRKHITLAHPDMNPLDTNNMIKVKKTDLPEEQYLLMKRLSKISKSRKMFLGFKKILPQIKAFNCHDCDGSFPSINELFDHCKTNHRKSESGTSYPFLIA